MSSTALLFARERFSSIIDEMMPLLHAHYKEIAWRQDQIPLDVDRDRYNMIDEQGVMMLFTGRDGKRLVAYAVFFVSPHLHYSQTRYAVNDVIFVHPQYRSAGNGTALINYCEKELKAFDVDVVTLHIKPQLDWGNLAASLGYEPSDRIWQKWIRGSDSGE